MQKSEDGQQTSSQSLYSKNLLQGGVFSSFAEPKSPKHFYLMNTFLVFSDKEGRSHPPIFQMVFNVFMV